MPAQKVKKRYFLKIQSFLYKEKTSIPNFLHGIKKLRKIKFFIKSSMKNSDRPI